ncbi:MAG: VWA domain-containing protein [Ginsengibacter sp.]
MIDFENTPYLLVLLVLPIMVLLYFSVKKWKRKTALKIGDPLLVKELIANYSPTKFLEKFILFIAAFALCVFAIAGLRKPDTSQKINRKGTDIVIALDVSKSMLAQDIKPNRLERAKQLISTLIEKSPNDRFALVLFAGRAYLQMPLTMDVGAINMYLSSASPDNIGTQGTVISDALKMSASAFNLTEKTYQSIVLISDGEDHDNNALKVTKDLAKAGIMVNTIGIGSPSGAPIIDEETGAYKLDNQGQTVISKLNEKELSEIAKEGNGIYQLYTNPNDVAQKLVNQLSGKGFETTVNNSSYASFKEYFQYFLALAFLLLLIEFFIGERKKIKISKIATFLLLMLFSIPSFSQSVDQSIEKGNQFYQKKDFENAAKEYQNALKKSNGKNATANFNMANTLFKKGNSTDAISAYNQTIENSNSRDLQQNALYNKGVVYQKENKITEAIDAYKKALILNPNDEDARQNLQRALQQNKNSQNNKDKDKKDNKKNEENDKNKKDPQKPNPDQQQEPKQQPSKMSKQDAEEKLKSLAEQEKSLQEKLNKMKAGAPNKPEKDW